PRRELFGLDRLPARHLRLRQLVRPGPVLRHLHDPEARLVPRGSARPSLRVSLIGDAPAAIASRGGGGGPRVLLPASFAPGAEFRGRAFPSAKSREELPGGTVYRGQHRRRVPMRRLVGVLVVGFVMAALAAPARAQVAVGGFTSPMRINGYYAAPGL